MIVQNGGVVVMPPARLSVDSHSRHCSPPVGDHEGGGDTKRTRKGENPLLSYDLPRLLAITRHGDLGTLPPDQRHLLARLALARGVMSPEALLKRQAHLHRRHRLLHYRRRLHHLQRKNTKETTGHCSSQDDEGFKQPDVPAPRHSRGRVSPHHRPQEAKSSGSSSSSYHLVPPPPPPQPPTPLDDDVRSGVRDGGGGVHEKVYLLEESHSSTTSSFSSSSSSFNCESPHPPLPQRQGGDFPDELPPRKRLRSKNSKRCWVPVVTTVQDDQSFVSTSTSEVTSPSCSSSSSSSSSSSVSSATPCCSRSEWKTVKVAHLCDNFKNSRKRTGGKQHYSSSSTDILQRGSYMSLGCNRSPPSSSSSSSSDEYKWCLNSKETKSEEDLTNKCHQSTSSSSSSSTCCSSFSCPQGGDERSSLHPDSLFLSNPPPPHPSLTPSPPPKCSRYHWTNQLTRIFLQEVPEDELEKEGESPSEGERGPASASSSSPSPSNEATAAKSPGSSAGNTCTSTDSSANPSNKSATSSVGANSGAPVATTLAGSGMGNPFARAAPQPSWGQASESHDHKPILAPSRLGPQSDIGTTKVSSSGGSSVLRQPTLQTGRPSGAVGKSSSSIFTPPTLTVTGSSPPQPSKSAFKLKPSVLGSANPFSKVSSNSESSGSDDKPSGTTEETSARSLDVSSSTGSTHKTSPSGDRDHSFTADSRTSSSNNSSLNNSSNSRNVFVPLSRNGDSTDSSLSPNIRNSFIFGQNLQSKVTGADSVTSSSDAASSSATTNGERPSAGNLFSEAVSIARSPDSAAATNGRIGTGNLFTEAASEIGPVNEDAPWNSGPSLAESSRELTEKENSQKRKFDQVEVITGEESESNVLQMNCKLYAWVAGSWQERGRGILRLNDWDAGKEIHSRLVIRTQGTLTVMLNTKVWAEMSVERASSKSVRFTALDADGQPKIFLAMGSPKDVDLLYNSLEWRVAASRSQTHEEGDSDSTKKSKKDEAGATALTR